MAGRRTLLGNKGHNPLSGQLNGLTGSQIFCNQQERSFRQLEAGIAAENIIEPVGHIPNIGASCVHILIVHSREYLGKFLTGIQRCHSSGRAIFNGHVNAIQIVQIIQHQQLHFHDCSLFFADLHLCLFEQSGQLLACGFQGSFEFCLFQSRITGRDRQGTLYLAIHHSRANGYAGEYRQTNTFFHKQLLTLPVRSPHHHW